MLILTEYANSMCKVLDTDDNVIEAIDYESLVSIVQNGVEILGFTEYGKPQNSYIRFYSEVGDYYFDGYSGYRSIYGDISETQIILFKDSYEELEKIIPYLRSINISDKPSVTGDSEDYTYTFISTSDNIYFSLLDFNNLTDYHYLDIVALLATGTSIKHIVWNGDCLVVKGICISPEASLRYLCKSSNSFDGAVKSISNERLNEFSSDIVSLGRQLPPKGYLSTTYSFPLYNIKDWVVPEELFIPDDIAHSSIQKVLNNGVILDDGTKGDFTTCASLIESKEDKAMFDGILTKKALLGVDVEELQNVFNQSVVVDYGKVLTLKSQRVDYRNKDCKKFDYLINTPFGRIKAVWKFSYNKSILNGFFGTRITHLGCYWYSAESNSVQCTRQKDITPGVVSGDNMEKMIQSQWRLNSYSYHENTIFPIALREVKVTNQGVELIVNCIVKDADTVGLANWRGCAEGFVSIPLLFMGCPLSLTNNIYKLNGLMMDIYMESGVFNNLVGNFSNSDLFIDFNNKTKMVRELKSWNTSAVMGTMRKVEK